MELTAYSSQNMTELAKAMLKVQQALMPVAKDAENPFVKSRYATLNAVMDACREVLLVNGIWVSQYPVPVESGCLGLVTKLMHAESGEWQASCMVMPLPKADPQGYGSALTYARRYALATLVGLVTEIDDDAEAAIGRERQSRTNQNTNLHQLKREPRVDTQEQQQHISNQSGGPQASLSSFRDTTVVQLPQLDGVVYQQVQAKDGRTCVTASGNTKAKKPLLKEAGFRWDNSRNIWWKYADAHAV
ncbi:ERF family protein [Halodesulfovibrio marinisediminis]|uniref:ERF superfamily protein n=1 Tax=Halodesulfovibrio marinisediminis DSM 17456 TaxID=1121457 RepID=A0A1N6IFK2_9BACT|nr:ERF family protein [Halodesulfovibrio marinisediminis]SIO30793.1 ERF superfamily protein [Halodesulfovibrio marinisediminis DSM 17456]